MQDLQTLLPDLSLVQPDVARDASESVKWLAGEAGRDTLRLMGNTDEDNRPSSLEAEKDRIRGFLDSTDQLNWTLIYKGKPVGAVWVDLKPSEYLPSPSVHIMLGDPAVRGKGLGTHAIMAIIQYLQEEEAYTKLYSRHLATNSGSAALLRKTGFKNLGPEYADKDGLHFQNLSLKLS